MRGIADPEIALELLVGEQHRDIDAVEEGDRDRQQQQQRDRPARARRPPRQRAVSGTV